MDANDRAVGSPVSSLQDAEYVQISFLKMPQDIHVLESLAAVTINSAVRMEVRIPEQDIHNGLIFVRDLSTTFNDFPK